MFQMLLDSTNGILNLTLNQIIKIDPINISNLIASVILALATVYVTLWLNQKRDFKNSRDGLITEISRNFIRCEHILTNVNEIIANYSRDTEDKRIRQMVGFEQDYSAYNYFTQQGHFIKLPSDLRILTENYYLSSKFLLELFRQDTRYRDDLKKIYPRIADFAGLRLEESLLRFQSKLVHHKEIHDVLIDEMIKMRWLTVDKTKKLLP